MKLTKLEKGGWEGEGLIALLGVEGRAVCKMRWTDGFVHVRWRFG